MYTYSYIYIYRERERHIYIETCYQNLETYPKIRKDHRKPYEKAQHSPPPAATWAGPGWNGLDLARPSQTVHMA